MNQKLADDKALLTLYANSITLTPGTITVDVDKDRLLIHSVDSDAVQGLKEMQNQISK